MAISNNVQMALVVVNKTVAGGGVWGRERRERERDKGKRNEGGRFALNVHVLDVGMENPSAIKK